MTGLWTLVVPVFDEGESAAALIQELREHRFPCGNFILVDNGSHVPLRCDEAVSPNQLEILRLEENRGFGGGIKAGVARARSEWVGWMPGNLKVMPSDVLLMEEHLLAERWTFIKARRGARPLDARIKTLAVGAAQSLAAGKALFDSGGTPTFIRREFAPMLHEGPDDYLFESFVMYRANQLSLCGPRPVVPYRSRRFGRSHWQRGLRTEVRMAREMVTSAVAWRRQVSMS